MVTLHDVLMHHYVSEAEISCVENGFNVCSNYWQYDKIWQPDVVMKLW